MSGAHNNNSTHIGHPTLPFQLACWLLGLVAFAELLTAGVALASRLHCSQKTKEASRIVPHVITIPSAGISVRDNDPSTPGRIAATPPPLANSKARTSSSPVVQPRAPLPPPTPLSTPQIADPTVERLVNEARKARVAEDMGMALVKLQEAARKEPNEPNLLYEFGLIYELMGVYDRAEESFQKVLELGTDGAGALYEQAAIKLRDGFDQPESKFGRLSLGRVRVFHDRRVANRERVILTVPVQAVPGENIDPSDLEVVVRFFDEVEKNGEPQPAAPESTTSYRWATEPIDWQTGEEILRVTYTLPDQDIQEEHLFGKRHYHGQVVELVYRGTLIDSQAWPRILARRVDAPERDPLFLDKDLDAPDFNPDAPLLPPPLPEP
jgi:hypothetical protein